MPTQSINIAELIADKIKVRYAEITERTMGTRNMVVDAFYPTYVRKSLTSGINPPVLGKKCSAISPFLANELGVFQIPFEDLVKMLGYSKLKIKELLETIKAKNIDLVLVGLGGTGMNFMHWATEACNYTNTINIFNNIIIYDHDKLDITNIFRFPMILNPYIQYSAGLSDSMYKLNAIPDQSILSAHLLVKNAAYINKNTLMYNNHYKINSDGKAERIKIPIQEIRPEIKNYVFYGAPDIETREMFSSIPEIKFISGTHGDDDCQLYIKPPQDSVIQVESYGMINLSVFFMNQLKLTLSFLELLASDTNLSEPRLIMEYSFAKEYSNGRTQKAGLNRAYNFPINTESFIDQEVNSPEQEEEDESQADTDMQEQQSPDAVLTEINLNEETQVLGSESDQYDHGIWTMNLAASSTATASAQPETETGTATTTIQRRRRRSPAEMAEARARGEVRTRRRTTTTQQTTQNEEQEAAQQTVAF